MVMLGYTDLKHIYIPRNLIMHALKLSLIQYMSVYSIIESFGCPWVNQHD